MPRFARGSLSHPLRRLDDVMKDLVSAIDTVCDADPAHLCDADTLVGLHRQRARLDAVIARATAAFDADRGFAADGAKTTAAWLATTTRIPMQVAKREERVGRALRDMPLVEEAFLAGDITIDHVSLLGSAQRCAEKAFERDEKLLVDHAQDTALQALQQSDRLLAAVR